MATRRSNVGTDQAWQQTQHIDPGDSLLTADGHVVGAGNLLWDTAHYAPAFDLTINGIHTYHVTAGDEEVLVHNTRGSTNFPDEPDLRLSPDEVATANRLVELERFEGTEFRDFEAEFSDNTFDYIDQNGDLYDQIGGRTEISDECSSWVS